MTIMTLYVCQSVWNQNLKFEELSSSRTVFQSNQTVCFWPHPLLRKSKIALRGGCMGLASKIHSYVTCNWGVHRAYGFHRHPSIFSTMANVWQLASYKHVGTENGSRKCEWKCKHRTSVFRRIAIPSLVEAISV